MDIKSLFAVIDNILSERSTLVCEDNPDLSHDVYHTSKTLSNNLCEKFSATISATPKQWRIKHLKWSNYLCYGNNCELFLNEQQIAITAHNMGGKTSFIDMIIFAIFGKFIRGNADSVVRVGQTEFSTEVSMIISARDSTSCVTIKRTQNVQTRTNKCVPEINGKIVSEKDLHDVIGTCEEFLTMWCMRDDHTEYILHQNGDNIAQILTRVFDLDWCKNALDALIQQLANGRKHYDNLVEYVSDESTVRVELEDAAKLCDFYRTIVEQLRTKSNNLRVEIADISLNKPTPIQIDHEYNARRLQECEQAVRPSFYNDSVTPESLLDGLLPVEPFRLSKEHIIAELSRCTQDKIQNVHARIEQNRAKIDKLSAQIISRGGVRGDPRDEQQNLERLVALCDKFERLQPYAVAPNVTLVALLKRIYSVTPNIEGRTIAQVDKEIAELCAADDRGATIREIAAIESEILDKALSRRYLAVDRPQLSAEELAVERDKVTFFCNTITPQDTVESIAAALTCDGSEHHVSCTRNCVISKLVNVCRRDNAERAVAKIDESLAYYRNEVKNKRIDNEIDVLRAKLTALYKRRDAYNPTKLHELRVERDNLQKIAHNAQIAQSIEYVKTRAEIEHLEEYKVNAALLREMNTLMHQIEQDRAAVAQTVHADDLRAQLENYRRDEHNKSIRSMVSEMRQYDVIKDTERAIRAQNAQYEQYLTDLRIYEQNKRIFETKIDALHACMAELAAAEIALRNADDTRDKHAKRIEQIAAAHVKKAEQDIQNRALAVVIASLDPHIGIPGHIFDYKLARLNERIAEILEMAGATFRFCIETCDSPQIACYFITQQSAIFGGTEFARTHYDFGSGYQKMLAEVAVRIATCGNTRTQIISDDILNVFDTSNAVRFLNAIITLNTPIILTTFRTDVLDATKSFSKIYIDTDSESGAKILHNGDNINIAPPSTLHDVEGIVKEHVTLDVAANYCVLCELEFKSNSAMKRHLSTKKHIQKINKLC